MPRMPIVVTSHISSDERQETDFPLNLTVTGFPNWPKMPSLSWMKNFGHASQVALRICCFNQSRVGCSGEPTFRRHSPGETGTPHTKKGIP